MEPMPAAGRAAEALRGADATVAVAETVTGGLVGAQLSAVPGASDYFAGGYVAYDYDALRETVGVARETLDEHGAVSAPVTRELACRARDRTDTTWGVSTAGVAGPGGGGPDRPVGTGFVGVAYAGPWGTETSTAWVERHGHEGDRGAVRDHIAAAALSALARRAETAEPTATDPEP